MLPPIYYNENDPYCAEWLRRLMARNVIAPGEVDERDIRLVRPDDLRGFRQCHFFAGLGAWSYALRLAGWTDDRPVWTGSCPCQPFSDAGDGEAFDDERDLWPVWFPLIRDALRERRDVPVVGEQVASRLGLAWLDALCADMESETYTVGAVDTCSAGFGASDIRQRLYWVAVSGERGREIERAPRLHDHRQSGGDLTRCGQADRLADASGGRTERHRFTLAGAPGGSESEGNQRERFRPDLGDGGDACRMGEPFRSGLEGHARHVDDGNQPRRIGTGTAGPASAASPPSGLADPERDGGGPEQQERQPEGRVTYGRDRARPCDDGMPGPTNGFWRAADWLFCRDGKWRPVEPGTFPLAAGAPGRMGRLRAYGNAINAQVAAEFIRAYMDEVGG